MPSRAWLEERVAALDRPAGAARLREWGGYRLDPRAWEFWQHRANRLHDRFRYTPAQPGDTGPLDDRAPRPLSQARAARQASTSFNGRPMRSTAPS